MSAAEKLDPKPTPWRSGLPVKFATLVAGPQWRGIRNGQTLDRNVFSAKDAKGVRGWFWSGCLVMESAEHGVALMPLAQVRHMELDLA